MVTFVRGTIPGETVRVVTQETRHSYQVATLSEVLEASAERVQPACGVYGHCGGCQFQHVKYEAQLIQKQQLLEEALSRIGRVSINQFEPPMPSPLPYEYRSPGAPQIRSGTSMDWDDFRASFQPIEIVRPVLHHLPPLGQVGCAVIGTPVGVAHCMG